MNQKATYSKEEMCRILHCCKIELMTLVRKNKLPKPQKSTGRFSKFVIDNFFEIDISGSLYSSIDEL